MKKKISLGFLILACVLIASSLISVFEFTRLHKSVSNIYTDHISAIGGIAGQLEEIKPDNCQTVIDSLSQVTAQLQYQAMEIDGGFYRSTMPGVIAAAAGIILIIIFNYFINLYFVNPLIRINKRVQESLRNRTKYTLQFDGDEQLMKLNDTLSNLLEEHRTASKKQT